MATLTQRLGRNATYHRDARNIATHFIGIPMIVLGLAGLLSRPHVDVAGMTLTLAMLGSVGAALFYWSLSRTAGLAMFLPMVLANLLGLWIAHQSTPAWLAIGIGGFVVGWVFQFWGHHYEGRKPAFADDMTDLLVGPLFIGAEALFMLGLCGDLKRRIEIERSHAMS